MQGPTAEERAAEREFIAAYFEEEEQKIAFLVKLEEEGQELEARTLCLVYIDGLANWLHLPDRDSPKNFSKALTAHSGNEELFSLVRPGWLMKALPWKSSPKGLGTALTTAFSTLPDDQWFLPSEVLDGVRAHLTPGQFKWLQAELWRGSIANGVYTSLRSPGVHYGGVRHGLSFASTFHGNEIRRIDFDTLHPALVSLAAHAKKVSEETGQWFGVA
jgi:hypothetical protein